MPSPSTLAPDRPAAAAAAVAPTVPVVVHTAHPAAKREPFSPLAIGRNRGRQRHLIDQVV